MQVAPPGGKTGTNANCIAYWPNLEPLQVALFLAGEIAQVKGIPIKLLTWAFGQCPKKKGGGSQRLPGGFGATF